jgi:hypothetical protein
LIWEKKVKRIWLAVLIPVLVVGVLTATGCSNNTKIGDIQSNPVQFEGKQVNVKGTVGDTFWLATLSKGAYQLGDGSGTLWIVTSQPPPQKGVEIGCQGTVSTAIKLGDRTLGTVITETNRK